jgi:hypothetical protein
MNKYEQAPGGAGKPETGTTNSRKLNAKMLLILAYFRLLPLISGVGFFLNSLLERAWRQAELRLRRTRSPCQAGSAFRPFFSQPRRPLPPNPRLFDWLKPHSNLD